VGIAFIMFFVDYQKYWYRGVRLGLKDYLLAYEDLERKVRRITIAFIMYFLLSYLLLVLFSKQFLDYVARGAFFSAVFFPLLNNHFSQKEKYRFKTN